MEDDWCALWTGLAEVRPGHVEVFADVVDLTHAGWVGVDAALAVEGYGILAPGGLPEFVGYFDVFFGEEVAVVVLNSFC